MVRERERERHWNDWGTVLQCITQKYHQHNTVQHKWRYSNTQQPLRWQHCGYPLSILFISLLQRCCHQGCCVCSTCRIVSRLWLQPAPCKKPPTNRVGSRLPRGVCVGGLGNSSRSHYTWTLATLCACEQQLTTICRQQHGAEVRTLITNICLLQGSWWDNWILWSSKHSWLLHVPTTRERECVRIAIFLMPYWKLYTWMPVSISYTRVLPWTGDPNILCKHTCNINCSIKT